jgi:hypothetical protein
MVGADPDQLQEPDGTVTVSPVVAEFIAIVISTTAHDDALYVADSARGTRHRERKRRVIILVPKRMLSYPPSIYSVLYSLFYYN